MQNWKNITDNTQTVSVLLFDGFSNLCLANTIEPLRAANTLSAKRLYHWNIVTLNGQAVVSSSGMQVAPDAALSKASGDLLAVMPSYEFRAQLGWDVQAGLRAAAQRFPFVAGLDTGAWLMAVAGLLTGYRATIHWEELTSFSERFPDVAVERAPFLIDRDRITCSGARAAYDLLHFLIGQTHGQALALEVAQLLLAYEPGPEGTVSASDQAIALMQANLETPLTIGQIARHCGQTQKALELRMQATYGANPRTIYRRQRLNHARKLVRETLLSVSEVALRCGYDDPSALTRAFKSEFGVTPRGLRAALDQSA